jgi:hypothetical protein
MVNEFNSLMDLILSEGLAKIELLTPEELEKING